MSFSLLSVALEVCVFVAACITLWAVLTARPGARTTNPLIMTAYGLFGLDVAVQQIEHRPLNLSGQVCFLLCMAMLFGLGVRALRSRDA